MEARREKRQGKEKIRGSTSPPVEGGESETVEKEAQEKRIKRRSKRNVFEH
jgi:hypothetical protein